MPIKKPDSPIPLKGKGSKMTAKQAAFVSEYLVDLNGSAAVLRAGYITRNPNRIAAELRQHPLVSREIDKALAKRADKNELTATYVLDKLVAIVEATEEDNPGAALRGLEMLAKHLGLLRDKVEMSGPDGGAIQHEQKVKEDVADFTSAINRLVKRAGTDDVLEFPKPGSSGGT